MSHHSLVATAVVLIGCLSPISLWAGSDLPTSGEVYELIQHVNRQWQSTHPLVAPRDAVYTTDPDTEWTFKPYSNNSPFWDNAAYHTGNMEVCRLDSALSDLFLPYSLTWAESARWQGATNTQPAQWRYSYGEQPGFVLFGDWQICFQTYCDLYEIDPQPERIARAREVMEYQMSTAEEDYWWWADGLYMVMPVMTKLYRITSDPQYLEKLLAYWTYAKTLMYDKEEHLFYRDGKYLYPNHKSAHGQKDFWARGCGWVVAGLAKVIQDVPESWNGREEFVETFVRMCAAVRDCQQPEGYWTRSLLDAEHAPGPETSGTAFFTYGLLWGINSGLLPREEYLPTVARAWEYLTTVALQPDGRIGYVQPIGERAIPGQKVDARSTTNFGVGAFLLAACEMYRYAKRESEQPRSIDVGLGYSQTSVNTTVFRNSALATIGDVQYVGYYDSEGWLTLGKRRLGESSFETRRTQYRGKVEDAHNVISLMADGAGFLHVAFDHHNHPLHYARSVASGALQLGEMEPMLSPSMAALLPEEQDVTYPEFYRLASGNLLFAYRTGRSGRGNLVLNRYDLATRRWERVQDVLIDGEEQRNAYWQLFVDARGTIHVSWVWRETWMVETNHDLCYARSVDEGRTWQRSDGSSYVLPITAANAEYACRIPQRSELINQTSMGADAEGHPYIASYWRDSTSTIPQYRLVRHDGRNWHQQQVGERQTPFTLAGGGTKRIPIARPRVAIDGKRAWYFFRDVERGSRVSLFYSPNLDAGEWETSDLTEYSVEAWEPSFDTELWKTQRRLHLFVQKTHQGDGERTVEADPTMVRVLELR